MIIVSLLISNHFDQQAGSHMMLHQNIADSSATT